MKTQAVILKLEHRIVNIIHLNSYLYLLEKDYSDFTAPEKKTILLETSQLIKESTNLAYTSLNQLKEYKKYLPQKFKTATLQDYIFNKNVYRFNPLQATDTINPSSTSSSSGSKSVQFEEDNISLMMMIMEVLRSSHEIQNSINYAENSKNGQNKANLEKIDTMKELFTNLPKIFVIIYQNMEIDPYASFVTNYNYVIFLITASLILNTLNGVFIIKFLYESLKFLDKNYKLVTELGNQDILAVKRDLVGFKKMELGTNQIDLIRKDTKVKEGNF